MKNTKTYYNDKSFIEVMNLLHSFFPESKIHITLQSGIHPETIIKSMKLAGMKSDFSCNEYEANESNTSSFINQGGFSGTNSQILKRLLKHCNYNPHGRAIAMPDTIKTWTTENVIPIICELDDLANKLDEFDEQDPYDDFFTSPSRDKLLAFESGEVICIDHDLRLFWSHSKNKCITTNK